MPAVALPTRAYAHTQTGVLMKLDARLNIAPDTAHFGRDRVRWSLVLAHDAPDHVGAVVQMKRIDVSKLYPNHRVTQRYARKVV